jgi:hypothetical protein
MALVFWRIEYFIDGNRGTKIRLDKQKRNGEKQEGRTLFKKMKIEQLQEK